MLIQIVLWHSANYSHYASHLSADKEWNCGYYISYFLMTESISLLSESDLNQWFSTFFFDSKWAPAPGLKILGYAL